MIGLRFATHGRETLLWNEATIAPVRPEFFEAQRWPESVGTGRGAARGCEFDGRRYVLRHYRRGGLPARVSEDRYLFTGLTRSRPWREMELTLALYKMGLPVPRPVAARLTRYGLFYSGDLVTERIDAIAWADLLSSGRSAPPLWAAVGSCIARFHAAGLDHADLNARNLLVNRGDEVFLIDFDRGALREAGSWRESNLARLRRSLLKLEIFDAEGWAVLRGAYAEARPASAG